MKPLGVLATLAGIGAVVGLSIAATKKSDKSTSSKGDLPPAEPNSSTSDGIGMATNDQFQTVYDEAKRISSDMFENLSASQLSAMRSSFTKKLTSAEANMLIYALGKKESDWSVSEKIMVDTILKKWKNTSAMTPRPLPNVTTNPTLPPVKTTTPSYDILSDKEYDQKIPVLTNWRDALLAKSKKGLAGLFEKNIPSKMAFEKKFLPMSLSDLKTYVPLQLTEKKDRTVKDEAIMTSIRKKYPKVFTGITKIYSFSGVEEPNDLANGDLINM